MQRDSNSLILTLDTEGNQVEKWKLLHAKCLQRWTVTVVLRGPVGVDALRKFVEHLTGMMRCIMVIRLTNSSVGDVVVAANAAEGGGDGED